MKKIIGKHKNGLYFCELIDKEYPYSNVVGFGKTAVEAEVNTFELHKKILEKQLEINPVTNYSIGKTEKIL